MSGHLLELENITIGFGKEPVLVNVSLTLDEGECIAITGPNGSGKTSLLRTLSGFIKPVEGRIMFASQDITERQAWERTKMGIVHVLEGGRLFPSLTVQENMSITYNRNNDPPTIDNLIRDFNLLHDCDFLKRKADMLSGGERILVAIARSLYQKPKLFLLDSPFMGIGPHFRELIVKLIKRINNEINTSIIIVDHDTKSINQLDCKTINVQNKIITFVT